MHAAFLWVFERLFDSVIVWAFETRCSPVFHNRNHIAGHIEQQTEILRTRARVLLRAGPSTGFLFVATRSWITARIITGSLRLMDFQSGDRGARWSCLSVMNLPAIRSWVVPSRSVWRKSLFCVSGGSESTLHQSNNLLKCLSRFSGFLKWTNGS